ncbi:microfibril-associated glycoprotein 4-like isoform X8 [Apostichopus japonicus]|uniref:microfibril-associated glycoprotein 4-like isoform X8 n=1 Tax=Stichopus japonicus TaxID=307972 RepID=UPI003AB4B5F9
MAVKENSICFQHLLIFMACFGSSLAAGRLCEFAEKFPGVGGSCYKGPTNDATTKQSTTSPPISTLSSLPDTAVSSVETTTQSTTAPPVESSSQSIDTTRLSTPTVCLRGQLRCYNDDNEMVCAAPENCTCQMTSVNASISAGGFYVNPDCTRMAHCINGNVTWDDVYSCSLNAQCEEQNNVRRCYCKTGYHGDGKTCLQLTNCQDVYTEAGINESGIYTIKPTNWTGSPFPVYCNMAAGGGWTVFQRRVDGSVDFYRNWTSYKEGFGELDHEFWLGNDKLYYLTNQGKYQLRIDLVDRVGSSYFAKYDLFRINDENDMYRLSELGAFSGTAKTSSNGDDALQYHMNQQFSTHDRDNDGFGNKDCARLRHGGWWYHKCCMANLNSDYNVDLITRDSTKCCGDVTSVCWRDLPGPDHYLKYTEMKIRPV